MDRLDTIMTIEDQLRDHAAQMHPHHDVDLELDGEEGALQDIEASLEELLQHLGSLAAFKPSVAEEHHAARYVAGDITLAEFLAAEV